MVFATIVFIFGLVLMEESSSNFLSEVPAGFKTYRTPKSFVNDLVKEATKYHPKSIDDFGQVVLVNLNAQKKNVNENLMIAPYSIHLGLQMVAAGSNANTFSEFINTLSIPNVGSPDALLKNRGFVASAESKKKVFTAAYSIWINNKFGVYKSYVDSVKNAFNSSVFSLDFSSDAANEINSWVSSQTKKVIKSVVNEVGKEDLMLLINTLYFKGRWEDEFDVDLTTSGSFTRVDTSVQEAQLMHLNQKLDYFSDEYIQAVILPFDKGLKLVVILPKGEGSIALDAAAKKYLVHDRISHILFNIFNRKVKVELPRFNVSYSTSLKDTLIQIGLESAFSDDANFSFISPQKVKISEILHHVVLNVNEAGAQIAAATSVKASATSTKLPKHDDSIPFTVNRPFIYALLEEKTTLFAGIVRDLGTEVTVQAAKANSQEL